MPLPYAAAVALYCFLIFSVSGSPSPPVPDLRFPHSDKLLHAAAFGVLALMVSLGMRASDRMYTPRVYFWVPVAFAAAYGAFDEIHQYFVPLRECDILDWVADVTGALLVQGVLCWGWWRLSPWEGPPRYGRDSEREAARQSKGL